MSTSATTIETAVTTDADYLFGAIREYFAYDGIRFDEPKVREGIRFLLANPQIGRAWVLRHDGEPLGYAIVGFGFDLEFGGRQATLTDLFIHAKLRRRGLATRLLGEIEKTCRSLGIGALELQAELDNEEAIALYLKHGFVKHTRQPMSKRFQWG